MKLRGKFFLSGFGFLLLFLLWVCAVKAQIGNVDRDAKVKPTLVVLGTYRMRLAGNNKGNSEFDDVTTPERQKQLSALIEKLKEFKPTKIAVEINSQDDAGTQRIYDQYLAGRYPLSRNETNQIGFRLAKESGHKKVYCVDWNEFPNDPSYNFENYASKDAELDNFLNVIYRNLKQEVDEEREKLSTLTVIDQLVLLNQPGRMNREHQMYFDLMRIGRGGQYAGANYLSWWYGRNMKILANIIRITDSPKDRILIIYGYGHAKILTQLAKESGYYNIEDPLKYLKSPKKLKRKKK